MVKRMSRARSRKITDERARPLRMLISVATALLVVVTTLIPTTAAVAFGQAAVRNVKSANATVVGPGDSFNWIIQVGCSVLTDECVNAVLTDEVPAEFILPAPEDILLTPPLGDSERTTTISGQTVTVQFHQNLTTPVGQKGLTNSTVTVTIPVTVRSDLDYTPTPRTVVNTSEMVAENATMVPSSASVQLIVPLELATQPTKSFSPDSNIAVAGLATELTLGGSNTSNTTVSSLTIQDPVNPAAASNIFRTALELKTLDSVTWPAGATSAVVSLWDTSLVTPAWVDAPPVASGNPLTLPAGVDPADAGGIRIAFSSGASADIPRAASASFTVGMENRTGVSAATYPNIAQSVVERDALSADKPVTANYTVAAATSEVSAGKSISPDRMSAVTFSGKDLTEGTVTLSGGNSGSIPLTSLTISEPSDPTLLSAANPLAPAHTGGGLIFSGFTGDVAWPAGATAASITYYFANDPSETIAATAPGLPAPTSLDRVTGFSVTFTGDMEQGVAASVPFTIKANPLQVAPNFSVEYTNEIKVVGVDFYDQNVGPEFASDTVTVLADQINVETSKALSRGSLRATAGQSTTATLTTHVLDYPFSTRAIDHIDMVDPSTETGLTDWYTYFNATRLVVTPVPGDATLTISYRDAAGTYVPLTVLGPGIQNYDIPSGVRDSIYGLKFSWDSTTGFQPDQTLVANVEYALRATLRDSATALPNAAITLENCSASSGTSGTAPTGVDSNVAVSDPCPTVTLVPYEAGPGTGTANFLDKNFINTNNTNSQQIMNTRDSERTRARLSWSTDGYTEVEKMVIYDGAVDGSGNPDPAALTKGMYDAYDLYQIPKISSIDPLVKYDKVAIEFYSQSTSTWVSISGYCTLAAPCNGGTANTRTLNAAQQADYIAVRFTFTEGTNRPGLNPAPGSGVADSLGHNRRIDLVFQMRDSLRTNAATPVVDGYRYNADMTTATPPGLPHSVVRNDAHAEATLAVGGPLSDRAHDTLQLIDPPLAVAVNKTWTGGPIPIPDGPVVVQPTSRVSITATNQTAARVDSLTISEPNTSGPAPNDSPFEDWDLTRFQSISAPTGATGLTVTVVRSSGGNLVETGTPAAVASTMMGWTAVDLANATGFTMEYTGNIKASNGQAVIVLDLTLRTATRTGGGAIAEGTDRNSTQAVVADSRWDETSLVTAPTFIEAELSARDDASIDLFATSLSVSTSKTFGKATETEPSQSIFPLTLEATPGGTERVQTLTITDDRATFWNAFNFTGMAANQPTLPQFSPTSSGSATVIRVEACVDSTWSAAAVDSAPDASCTDRGGHWVGSADPWKTQTESRASFLPAGVTAGQVEGLRFTVKRLDDSQWENPQAPKISIPILVQRRDNLRTGDPVLTNLFGHAAAPGETVPGTTTNALTADVLGIWGNTATASNTASYLFQHATTAVRVLKQPTGVKAPGRTFDYTLSVTNTGTWPILNPIITDYLPSDGVGAQLVFDPDKPLTYKYTLSGAAPAPATGTALPTGTSGPTVDVTADSYGPTEIQFTFPAGSVLEVGQVYVITIPMMFRPGLVNDTVVTNTFGIRGDRLFDSCTAPAGATASYNAATGECSTGTTVRPSEQAALRALMTVRAELDVDYPKDQGFNGGTNAECTTAEDADGFSRLPCIPLTLPGQKETWRLTAQNTGTTYMPRVVLSTRLPNVNDETILDGFIRDSRWAAGFTDEITANIGVPGSTMTVYYTTATEPCKSVLQTPSNPDACGNDPETGWAVWTAGALADPTIVTGLQFVIDFPDSHLFAPAELLTIDVVTRTAALSSTPGADTTANNSLSASAITRTGITDTPVTALDYSVVSVALATGGLRLEKEITGPAASFIPDGQTFEGKVVCTSLSETLERDFTMTLSGGTVAEVTINNLPGGASCTVNETTASGQTSYSATTVTIDPLITDPASFPKVTLSNDYQLAGLTVSKSVTTTAPVIPIEFAFTVSCTFLGVAVPLAAADASFTLDDTESRTITGIPANADCVVTETDPKGADATIMTASTDASNTGSGVVVDNSARTATFTRLSPNGAGDVVTNTANANNRFDAPAALIVSKKLLGDGAAQFGEDKTFTVAVLCTFGATTQYDDSVLLNVGNAWQVVLENIIAGSDCTFTEAGLQGADAVVITPNDGADTTVGVLTVPGPTIPEPSPIVNIDVTNWYLTGSVEVTKTFAGDAGAIDKFARNPVPEIEFEFSLSCVRDGEVVIIPGGETRTVTAAAPVADYTGLASGSECTLTETQTGGASLSRIVDEFSDEVVDGKFTVTVDDTVLSVSDQPQPNLSVENTYRFADVAATKNVTDVGAGGARLKGPFELTLTCTLDGREIEADEPKAQSIRAGETATWTELAEGADCTIVESVTGGATRTTSVLTAADGSTGPSVRGVSVDLLPLRWTGATAPNAITFTNSFSLAYTGTEANPASLVLLPLGMLLFGGLFLGFAATKRRGHREVVSNE